MSPLLPRSALVVVGCLSTLVPTRAVVTLGAEIVTATRTPQPAMQVAATVATFDDETLRRLPAATLDGALRSVPAFSLFRRSDSLTANPTAQGVSLRGLGPSGASRSLVLLDGVPLNDPFGGWVAWTKVPAAGLERIEVVPGGGATAWGNASLGGIVQLFTRSLQPETPSALSPGSSSFFANGTGRATAMFGDFGTRSAEIAATQPVGAGTVQLLGRAFSTDGFALVAPERRGPVDMAAWSRHRWIALRGRMPIGENLAFSATVRGFEETRGNGTPYQRNASREKFLSATLAGSASRDFVWNAVAYAQDQSFASTFSAVNATRTAETPASDQFAVPSTAFGAAWTGAWRHANSAHTSFGADARFVRGETRENFTFVNGAFTRQRIAGGEQLVGGIFVLHERPLVPTLRATLGLRADAWRENDGHRRETDRLTGAVLRHDRYADLDGTALSPNLGLVWQPAAAWRLRANAQHAFRRPTLNELYRPFRVGSNVTEANPALRTERVTSAEFGGEWTPFGTGTPPRPDLQGMPSRSQPPPLTLGATAFWNDLRDAVGNVTLARGPGTFPLFGPLPAGGTGRQRLNLDRSRVRGLELSARWSVATGASLTADYLYNDARVTRALLAPALLGKRIAQVPRHSAALGAKLALPLGFVASPRVRWIGRQSEDDENQLRLGEAVIADLGLTHALTRRLELFLTVENLGAARIETGRSADGVVNLGTPRLALGGLRGRW